MSQGKERGHRIRPSQQGRADASESSGVHSCPAPAVPTGASAPIDAAVLGILGGVLYAHAASNQEPHAEVQKALARVSSVVAAVEQLYRQLPGTNDHSVAQAFLNEEIPPDAKTVDLRDSTARFAPQASTNEEHQSSRRKYSKRWQRWTEDQDRRLVELVKARTPYPIIVEAFEREFQVTRSMGAYTTRYYNMARTEASIRTKPALADPQPVPVRGDWTMEEDRLLLELEAKQPALVWKDIAFNLSNQTGRKRSGSACYGRRDALKSKGVTLQAFVADSVSASPANHSRGQRAKK